MVDRYPCSARELVVFWWEWLQAEIRKHEVVYDGQVSYGARKGGTALWCTPDANPRCSICMIFGAFMSRFDDADLVSEPFATKLGRFDC